MKLLIGHSPGRARSPFMVEVLSFPEEELGLLTRNAP